MELKKQRRIRDKQRVKAKARTIYNIQMGGSFVPDCGQYREALRRWKKHSDYLAKCSCTQCGNPRRKMRGQDNRTLQEIRFDLRKSDYQVFE